MEMRCPDCNHFLIEVGGDAVLQPLRIVCGPCGGEVVLGAGDTIFRDRDARKRKRLTFKASSLSFTT